MNGHISDKPNCLPDGSGYLDTHNYPSFIRSCIDIAKPNMSVLRQRTNLKRWKRSVSYGKRWMVETVFSCIKRTFGEYVNARKFHNMTKELIIKASLYNMFVAKRM
jgi:transposase